MSSRSASTGDFTRSTPSAHCSESQEGPRLQPTTSYIPASGSILHVVGVCINRIGTALSFSCDFGVETPAKTSIEFIEIFQNLIETFVQAIVSFWDEVEYISLETLIGSIFPSRKSLLRWVVVAPKRMEAVESSSPVAEAGVHTNRFLAQRLFTGSAHPNDHGLTELLPPSEVRTGAAYLVPRPDDFMGTRPASGLSVIGFRFRVLLYFLKTRDGPVGSCMIAPS